jgi:hypothetical protein
VFLTLIQNDHLRQLDLQPTNRERSRWGKQLGGSQKEPTAAAVS